jgi:hypothetical protein
MTSASRVALALVLAAGLIGVARAQAPSPGLSPDVREPCVAEYAALRSKVEKTGMAVKAGAESRAQSEELCKLVTAYALAEIKWVKFAQTNMTKCEIPASIVDQIKTVHAKTIDGQKKLCAAAYLFGPPTIPNDVPPKSLPRFSGR